VATTFGPSALATPANAITLVRIVLLPVQIALIMADAGWFALALWVVLSVSDLFDGWLARRQGATRSGAYLDSLADKILILGAMAALVAEGVMWWVPVAIIALREALMSAYRSYVGRRGVSVPARLPGKVKMWFQAIVVGLAIAPVEGDLYRGFWVGVLWAAVALTVVTGVQYAVDGRRVLTTLGGPGSVHGSGGASPGPAA
jgi:CDP-diacylglycerol--glycerol-3-phosphate 3-phosphatidyltransferase